MTRSAWMMCVICGSGLLACVERPLLGDEPEGTGTSTTDGAPGETTQMPTSDAPGTGGPGGSGTAGESGIVDTTTGGAPGTASTADTANTASTSGTSGPTSEDDSCGFLCPPDVPGELQQCDVFAQDCPDGEKCAAYAEGGGSSWNASKCVPVMGDGQPGEPCMVVDNGVSGLDDCAKGVMCWDADEGNVGTCVALCTGSEEAPVCPEEGACSITSEVVLNLCLPSCDPLGNDCGGDDVCVPVEGSFVCVFDGSGDEGQVFDPCEYINVCDGGLLCFAVAAASECDQDAIGCCLPMCDLGDPGVVCPGVGQSCVSLFDGDPPANYEHVGICTLPL